MSSSCLCSSTHLQVSVLQVPQPESLLAVVQSEHGLHTIHKLLQTFLQGWDVIGQACILPDLRTAKQG